jgi:hypothetical protein
VGFDRHAFFKHIRFLEFNPQRLTLLVAKNIFLEGKKSHRETLLE